LDAFCDFVLSSLNIQRVYSLPTIARFYLANKISLNQVNNSIIINASGKANESRYLNDSLLFALILCLGSKFQDLAIIVTPDDKSRVCNILKSVDPINQSINIICDKDIFAVAGEISKYQYFIGTDGGMAHIAAGLGLKSVILFDRQLTEIWHPWTPHQISLRSSRGNIYDVSYLDILQSISKLISKE
jgi:ADP-heptose:LPS heptosyltransferase